MSPWPLVAAVLVGAFAASLGCGCGRAPVDLAAAMAWLSFTSDELTAIGLSLSQVVVLAVWGLWLAGRT